MDHYASKLTTRAIINMVKKYFMDPHGCGSLSPMISETVNSGPTQHLFSFYLFVMENYKWSIVHDVTFQAFHFSQHTVDALLAYAGVDKV